ncbi:MAG: NAD-dependent epimerase/dehydratase family protein [Pseudomonadota bacterium]
MSFAPKVLVTGANGFIGEALLPILDQAGFHVIAGTRDGRELPHAGTAVALGDMSATDWAPPDLSAVDAVVHLAAIAHRGGIEKTTYQQVNAKAPIRLAKAATKADCAQFIFLSTAKVLGDTSPANQAFEDRTPPNPPDAYSTAKHTAEKQIELVAADSNMTTINLRPPLVYGANPSGNLASLLSAIQRRGVTPLRLPLPLANTQNHRSLISLESLCHAIVNALKHPVPRSGSYLLADKPAISTSDLVRALAEGLGQRPPMFNVSPALLRAVLRLAGKTSLADRLLGDFVIKSDGFERDYDWAPRPDTLGGLRAMATGWAESLQHRGADR